MKHHSSRPAGLIRGLCPDFRYRDNWFRSTAFSACKDSRDRTDVITNVSMNWMSRTMDPRIIQKYAIESTDSYFRNPQGMYLLQIYHNGGRHRVGGSFSIEAANGKIPKWTVLPPHKRNGELLQLMALATAGFRFVPHMTLETLSMLEDRTVPLHVESVHARHAPYDRRAHRAAITGAGLQLGPEGQVKQLRAGEYLFLSDEVVKASLHLSSGNTAFFLLGYAAGMRPHRGTDDFEFLNPNFRVTRIQPLFCSTSWITDPVEFLGRLHYRGIQKSRMPARHALQKLSELFAEHLDLDTPIVVAKRV